MSALSGLPSGWVKQKRYGDFVRATRGNESAVFHVHDAPRHGTRSAPPTAHFCTWVGQQAQCEACGHFEWIPVHPTENQ